MSKEAHTFRENISDQGTKLYESKIWPRQRRGFLMDKITEIDIEAQKLGTKI